MDEQIIIAGFGGQGVQLMGQLLIKAAMEEGRFVTFLPSYGPEMRGGTTSCSVVLSSEPVASPIVSEATCVMALNLPSFIKFERAVRPGGALIVNSSLVKRECQRADVKVINVPANDIAAQLGNPRVANMVMLGAYMACAKPVKHETLKQSLKEALGERREHLLDINLKAIAEGAKCAE